MFSLYLLSTLLFSLSVDSETAVIQCMYGEQALCGSDGFTYYNKCDFEIVRSIRSDLTVRHQGACKRGGYVINPFVKVFNARQKYKETIKGLRTQRTIKNRDGNRNEFTRMLLSQIISSRTQLNGINFNVDSKGDNNVFNIQVSNKRSKKKCQLCSDLVKITKYDY